VGHVLDAMEQIFIKNIVCLKLYSIVSFFSLNPKNKNNTKSCYTA